MHVDPVNQPKDYVEDKIKAKLQKEAKCEPHQIPIFKVVMSSPSHMQDDNRLWTKSYDVQVERKYAKAMIRLIKQAYKVSKDFIFYWMRHEVPATFKAAIKAQNQFLNQARVVPIEGIPRDMMWVMEFELLALTGVKEVLPHWKTSHDGRWNLLTHAKAFSGVIRYLTPTSNYCTTNTSPSAKTFPKQTGTPKPEFARNIRTPMTTATATNLTSRTALTHTAPSTMTSPSATDRSQINHPFKLGANLPHKECKYPM